MENQVDQPNTPDQHRRLHRTHVVAALALIAPIAYIAGRYSLEALASGYWSFVTSGVVGAAIGGLVSLPIGLYFGTLAGGAATRSDRAHTYRTDTITHQAHILAQIRQELAEDQQLYNARRGDYATVVRIAYPTPFWTAAKASGQLFVVQSPQLLATMATAYYWLEQANHVENLAYEAKYTTADGQGSIVASNRLISEARLLDGPLGIALQRALDGIDTELALSDPETLSNLRRPHPTQPSSQPDAGRTESAPV
jgi:hypothetical protein